jgi:hypothetical protein
MCTLYIVILSLFTQRRIHLEGRQWKREKGDEEESKKRDDGRKSEEN